MVVDDKYLAVVFCVKRYFKDFPSIKMDKISSKNIWN